MRYLFANYVIMEILVLPKAHLTDLAELDNFNQSKAGDSPAMDLYNYPDGKDLARQGDGACKNLLFVSPIQR